MFKKFIRSLPPIRKSLPSEGSDDWIARIDRKSKITAEAISRLPGSWVARTQSNVIVFSQSFSLLALKDKARGEEFEAHFSYQISGLDTNMVLRELELEETGRSHLVVADHLRSGARVWFFLSRINALTISFSSAISDETAGGEEFVLTLETMALLRD
ncbi:hypothetical protein Tco_1312851 [Tanacetum coccineum]